MYMLKSVGDRPPPCGAPFLNCCVVVLFLNMVVCFAAFDVVCDVFDNGVWMLFVVVNV